MTGKIDPQAERERFARSVQSGMADMLAARGFAPAQVEALLALDAAQFQVQRRMAKGEFLQVLISQMGIPLERAQLLGLYAVARIVHGIDRAEPAPATIGLVAEELGLDPSRASRVVGDLVNAGYLLREASQTDGRVTQLTLTPAGSQLIADLRGARWEMLLSVFDGWAPDEIAQFSTLFSRYADGMARAIAGRGQGGDADSAQT